jgi:hypothetical protein
MQARHRLYSFNMVTCLTSRVCQVEPETVATDSFMVNLQTVLLRFAEPFMDANYTKVCFSNKLDILTFLT